MYKPPKYDYTCSDISLIATEDIITWNYIQMFCMKKDCYYMYNRVE